MAQKKWSESLVAVLRFVGPKSIAFLILGLIAALVLGVLELVIAGFIQQMLAVFGFITPDTGGLPRFFVSYLNSIEVLCSFLLLIALTRFVFQVISNQSVYYASEAFNAKLRSISIHDYLFNLNNRKNQSSDLFFRFTEIVPRAGATLNSTAILLITVAQCFTIYVSMFATAWRETIAATLGIAIIGGLSLLVSRKVSKINRLIPDISRDLSIHVQKASRNILLFRILKTQQREFNALSRMLLRYTSLLLRSQALITMSGSLGALLGTCLLSLLMMLSKALWLTQAGSFVSFLYLFTRLVQNVSQLSQHFGSIQASHRQFKLALQHFEDQDSTNKKEANQLISQLRLLGTTSTFEFSRSEPSSLIEQNLDLPPPSIRFQQVSFTYPGSKSEVLSNASIVIDPGMQLGIMGASGAGKSTILLLMMGLINPTSGEIMIDGMPPQRYFEKHLGAVGYVGAEPFLFSGTLRDNLIYGVPRAVSDDEVWSALSFAKMDVFVKSVGLSYEIGEDHSGLSAGQKQRICLARAILLKPKLLILDEASANLDVETEKSIVTAISSLKGLTTTISVSHRKEMLASADFILKLGLS